MNEIIEKTELINKVTDNIAEFVMNDSDIKDDYNEYLRTIGSDMIASTIPYIFERKLNSKSISELYLEKNKNIGKEEKAVIEGFKKNISSVFEVKKIHKNKFELFNIIDEQTYTVISPVKMTTYRGLGIGYYIVARFFNYENENYLIEMLGVYPSSKKEMAYRFAVSKILSNPQLVYQNNKTLQNKIKNRIEYSYNRFNELFETDEISTSNKYADELIEYLNGSVENLDWKSKIENVDVKKYFDVSNISNASMLDNVGFSTYPKEFDVTLLVDKEWGFYAIPFYKTFGEYIEGKEVENAKSMIEYFLSTNAVTPNILKRLSENHPNMMSVINKTLETNYTLDEMISIYKQEQSYSLTTVLEESDVFSKVIDYISKEEETNNISVHKVGRNDPCPCGSGKKYKKCCLLKSNN